MTQHRTRRARIVARTGAVGLTALLAITGAGIAPAFATTASAVAAETAAAESTTSATTPIAVKKVTPEVAVDPAGTPLGAITDVEQDGARVTLTAEHGAMRVTFLDAGTFRIEADPSGEFTDPANTPQNDPTRTADIVVGTDTFDGTDVTVATGDEIRLSTSDVSIVVDRATGRTAAERADGSVVWAESTPITFGASSATQHLADVDGEQFIGGGMQNGRFGAHRTRPSTSPANFDWDDDGYPNAVPYYMSSNGYGVLRNTFARGSYDFAAHIATTHEEQPLRRVLLRRRLQGVARVATPQLTGRPMMPPVYALEYGDADCYNRSQPDVLGQPAMPSKLRTPAGDLDVAKGFVEHDMPAGWMLVNDGYGCEYQELPETVDAIAAADRHSKTGLVDAALADRAGVRGRRCRHPPAQARRRLGRLGLSSRAHRLRGGARRHRAVLRRARHVAHGGGLGRLAALRHAMDRRPLGQPRRRALAGLGAHRRRQLRARRSRRVTSTASSAAPPRATCVTCSGRRSHRRSTP